MKCLAMFSAHITEENAPLISSLTSVLILVIQKTYLNHILGFFFKCQHIVNVQPGGSVFSLMEKIEMKIPMH